MNPLFSSIGVMHVDHYAVTTSDLMATLHDYLSIPGAKLLRGPGENHAQNVYFAFVELNGMGVVEILAPLNNSSPILSHIQKGAGAYHLCYAVADLDSAIEIAQRDFNVKVIVEPRADDAFHGRRVAFLVHPVHGLFELLEAYPSELKTVVQPTVTPTHDSADTSQLLAVLNQVLGTQLNDTMTISMDEVVEWDSFKHLMLIMEIEKQFDIVIPAQDMAELTSFIQLQTYLTQRIK